MWRTFGLFALYVLMGTFCSCQDTISGEIKVGAERTEQYIPLLKDKSVAVVANHTSYLGERHIVDSLLSRGVGIIKIFSPEHGFRGDKEAGEFVQTYIDGKTGIPVISLYGSRKKPTHDELEDVDIVVFDIQDVGVRFYTYISTMHYVMEACAETGTKFLVLDRPNPNGFYVDGPVLDTQYRSFVGMHPVPLVYGMTIAEYARMINNEGWLQEGARCELNWVSCLNYTHDSLYQLPVKPSPNLPNMQSVYLYPSLGLFEGTIVNVGRGTDFPFQVYGHPEMTGDFIYKPKPIKGASLNPKHKDKNCKGTDLRNYPLDSIFSEPKFRLEWILNAYANLGKPDDLFLDFFTNLAGNKTLKNQIEQGKTIEEIRSSWKNDIEVFKDKREKYLIYEDFTE